MSTLPQTSFNYINSIVGSGVIGIPYAFHRAGFGLGFLLLILVAVITDYSLILMVSIYGHSISTNLINQLNRINKQKYEASNKSPPVFFIIQKP